jgi:hypothetical protein
MVKNVVADVAKTAVGKTLRPYSQLGSGAFPQSYSATCKDMGTGIDHSQNKRLNT